MQQFPHLFSPLTVKNITFKNRICMAPQKIPDVANGGYISPRGQAYFEARARGGAGLITYGETYPQYHTALDVAEIWLKYRELDLHDRTSLIAFTDSIKRHGAVASIEFNHRGILSFPIFLNGEDPVGPCETTSPFGLHVRPMNEDDIEKLCEDFADAAAYVKSVGFDMCMLHAGHGWLFSQFLSPLTNKRTDRFGGSPENRARLIMMVLERVRQKCGEQFLIDLRISGDEETEGGLRLEDMIEFSRMVEPKIDMLHVSVGTSFDHNNREFSSHYDPNGLNVHLSEAIKKAVNIPVTTVGGINDAELAERIIAEGKADFVSMGRQMYADPDFARKAQEGRHREISPCIRCMTCHSAGSAPPPHSRCAVNPLASYEYECGNPAPSRGPKRVFIAGGGAAGMKAAVTCAERGHDVTLFEKSGRLGGILNFTDKDYYKRDLRKFKDHLIYMTEHCGAKIMLGTDLTPEIIERESPDVVFAAVGSSPIVPEIPGLLSATHVLEAYEKPESLGESIIIIGGGLAGCESALHFAALGKKVTIVEMTDRLFSDTTHYTEGWMRQRIYGNPMIVPLANTRCKEVLENGIMAEVENEGAQFIEADSVIYAVGMRSNSSEGLRAAAPGLYGVMGDAKRPAKVKEAVHEGYYLSVDI